MDCVRVFVENGADMEAKDEVRDMLSFLCADVYWVFKYLMNNSKNSRLRPTNKV